MVVRFFMLQSHYSSTLDFSNEALGAAERGYKRLMEGIKVSRDLVYEPAEKSEGFEVRVKNMIDQLFSNLSDDFNTAKGLAALFEITTLMNNFKVGNEKPGVLSQETFNALIRHYHGFVYDVLGLKEEDESSNQLVDGVIDILIKLRQDAKAGKNYALSDKIRDDLKEIGVILKDGKEGTEYSLN